MQPINVYKKPIEHAFPKESYRTPKGYMQTTKTMENKMKQQMEGYSPVRNRPYLKTVATVP